MYLHTICSAHVLQSVLHVLFCIYNVLRYKVVSKWICHVRQLSRWITIALNVTNGGTEIDHVLLLICPLALLHSVHMLFYTLSMLQEKVICKWICHVRQLSKCITMAANGKQSKLNVTEVSRYRREGEERNCSNHPSEREGMVQELCRC